jgi:hypothetical protein
MEEKKRSVEKTLPQAMNSQNTTIPTPTANAANPIPNPIRPLPSAPPAGNLARPPAAAFPVGLPFAVVSVPEPCACAQLSLAHAKPRGQQPPPESALQMYQPVAQEPVVVGAGMTTVATAEEMAVVLAVGGHESVWQSRSTRQQPPR